MWTNSLRQVQSILASTTADIQDGCAFPKSELLHDRLLVPLRGLLRVRCIHELHEGGGMRGVINQVKLREISSRLLHCLSFLA